jgi:hypothetical protein
VFSTIASSREMIIHRSDLARDRSGVEGAE